MAGIAISRTELDAAGLHRAAARSDNADASRRLLALARVLGGRTRTEAAELCGMDRQTLRDWVHRYNEFGLPGLSDRTPPDAKRRLSEEQEAELASLVREGPSLAEHGVVRLRRIDLSHLIKLANRVFETYEAIADACCHAWNSLVAQPKGSRPLPLGPGKNRSLSDADGISN